MVLRDIEKELVPEAIKKNIGILAYSPLQRGLLTGKINTSTSFNEGDTRADNPFFNDPLLSRINAFLSEMKPIAEGYGANLAQLVINWTVQQKGISSALVGARNEDQVEQNVKSLDFKISQEDMNIINSKIEQLNLNS
jgi:aryl-alcohol dehydrogenase-like predicted oxidoreductase